MECMIENESDLELYANEEKASIDESVEILIAEKITPVEFEDATIETHEDEC